MMNEEREGAFRQWADESPTEDPALKWRRAIDPIRQLARDAFFSGYDAGMAAALGAAGERGGEK